ncbi:MAG: 30S ribosomal protein S6 [Parcubacteria group bacterium]|nr:30S ribosomal protein S6 [Parcubacteria group bacterium]
MEETLINTKNYELAVHLRTGLNEEEFKKNIGEIEAKISNHGGTVVRVSENNKTKLSYPIRKQGISDFFWIDFSAPSSSINEITNDLKMIGVITRSLITTKIKEGQLPAPRKTFVVKPKPIPRLQEEKVEVKQEELDKRLEEILGNI